MCGTIVGGYLAVRESAGGRAEAGEKLQAIREALVEVLEQVRGGQAPIPVLHDVTAVHDLSEDIPHVLPRDLCHTKIMLLVTWLFGRTANRDV